VNPKNIQLFFRGAEIPVYIEGENDGIFNTTDYIEFYGIRNDGWLDSSLYIFNEHHLSKGRSQFNDTSYYFITWNSSLNNSRLTNETDNAFGSYISSTNYFAEIIQEFSGLYYDGPIYSSGKLNPDFDKGEGWATLFNGNVSVNPGWNAPFNNYLASLYASENASLTIHLISGNNPFSGNEHQHKITFGSTLVLDTLLDGFQAYKKSFTLPATQLLSSSSPYLVQFTAYNPAATIRSGIAYTKLVLPQVCNLGNRTKQIMYIPDATLQSKTRVDISGFNSGSTQVWIHDLTNKKRIKAYIGGPGIQALIPNGGGLKKCYITSESQIQTINSARAIRNTLGSERKFIDYQSTFRDFDYIILTHGSLLPSAQEYKNYRQQTGYNSIVINVEELYDQFAFGIQKHPGAIRNFLKMTLEEWDVKPEHLFLIGKGIRNTLLNPNGGGGYIGNYSNNLVPAIGVPPTDHLYGFRILDPEREDVAIGRLSATNNSQVLDYLDKVKEHEGNVPARWMKNIIHMGGGTTLNEQQQLASYLQGFENIIEDSLFGGNVFTVLKQQNQPFQQGLSDTVRKLINEEGVSLITIFGHGSGTGFDQDIDDPQNYYNTGKYPVFIGNSCLSGDIFQTSPLISEKFVLEPNKAALAFIASTSVGLSSFLKIVTDSIYKNIALDQFNQSVGKCIQQAVNELSQGTTYNSLMRISGLESQMHGDPAVRISNWDKPDLEILNEDVRFIPENITNEIDSFDIEVTWHNIGKTFTGPVLISATRKFPTPGIPDTTIYISRSGFNYLDTVIFKFPVDIIRGMGENVFTITADPFMQIAEMNESNNQVVKTINILSSEIIPVYPFKFQVVPSFPVTLKASTGNPFAPLKKYKIQIDTTDLFNSPFLRDTIIQQTGGVVKWKPAITSSDSTVYFWRTGVDSAQTGIFYKWKESSFQYIPNKYGWGQDHFFQFKDNQYVYMDDNRSIRKFEFTPNVKELNCITYPALQPGDCCQFNSEYSIDGSIQEEGTGPVPCGFNRGMYVAVIDPITLIPWGTRCNGVNPTNAFGNANDNCACYNRVSKYFFFNVADAGQRYALENFISNVVPSGHYILAYTNHIPPFTNASFWPNSLINAFENLGADTLRDLVTNAISRSYIFFTRKGYPQLTQESVAPANNMPAELTALLENDWIFGTQKTPLIGPASQWKSFHWSSYSVDSDVLEDSVAVNIIGVKTNGGEDILYNAIQPSTFEILDLYNTIDAGIYPYLKLSLFTRDDQNQTPRQLDRWHVLFEGIPEAALNPSAHFVFESDTIDQGKNLKISTAIENIGDYDMDSLMMRYFVIDKNNQIHNYFKKIDSLKINSSLLDTMQISTTAYPYKNSLWIEVNPINHPEHQLEQAHFNNIGQKNFYTQVEKINPLLDVTFDGIHITDEAIVSAKPEIIIQLKDENEALLLNDTNNVTVYLKKPLQSTPQKIHYGNPEISFIPATTSDNYCRVEFTPDLIGQDGTYQLLIDAKDMAENESGIGTIQFDYSISFTVVSKSEITQVLNYPNPFSTSTQFVFTLTGYEIPTEFKIQILTISGVVVREITQDEIGPIHIGNNVTSFKWNGTDEYGDPLATGVYLYRVIAKMNDKQIDRMKSNADKYFKDGFGKMYIIR
jgi:hypothetical protein